MPDRRHRREFGCPTWFVTDRTERWWYLYHMYHFNGIGESKSRCPPTIKVHAADGPDTQTGPAMDELQRNIPQIDHGLPVDQQPYEMPTVAGLDSRDEFPATQAVSTSFGQTAAMIVELPPSQLSQLAVRAPEAGSMYHHIDVMYGANVPMIGSSQPSYYYAPSHSGPSGFAEVRELYPQIPLGQPQYVDSYTQESTADINVTMDSISLEPYIVGSQPLWEPQPEPEESFLIQGYSNAVQS